VEFSAEEQAAKKKRKKFTLSLGIHVHAQCVFCIMEQLLIPIPVGISIKQSKSDTIKQ